MTDIDEILRGARYDFPPGFKAELYERLHTPMPEPKPSWMPLALSLVLVTEIAGVALVLVGQQPAQPPLSYAPPDLRAGLNVVTAERIGAIPAGTRVHILYVQKAGDGWIYGVQAGADLFEPAAEAAQLGGAFVAEDRPHFEIIDPPLPPLYGAYRHLILLDSTGALPAGSLVRVQAIEFGSNGWLYHLYAPDTQQEALVRESALALPESPPQPPQPEEPPCTHAWQLDLLAGLACPGEPPTAMTVEVQSFETGTMMWLKEPGLVLVLDEDGDLLHRLAEPLIRDLGTNRIPAYGRIPAGIFGWIWRGDVRDLPEDLVGELGWAVGDMTTRQITVQCTADRVLCAVGSPDPVVAADTLRSDFRDMSREQAQAVMGLQFGAPAYLPEGLTNTGWNQSSRAVVSTPYRPADDDAQRPSMLVFAAGPSGRASLDGVYSEVGVPPEAVRTVAVNGVPAALVTGYYMFPDQGGPDPLGKAITWQADGILYQIAVVNLPLDESELLRIAESVR
ncbi:MAG: hypothetical protein ACFB51_07240 [Anaerolineae bacterium]